MLFLDILQQTLSRLEPIPEKKPGFPKVNTVTDLLLCNGL